MSGLSLDGLRRLVRQQTVQIGEPVSNLIGPATNLTVPIARRQSSYWLSLRVPGTTLLSLEDFYAAWGTYPDRVVQELEADDGLVLVRHSDPSVFMLRGLAIIPTAQPVPVSISTGAAEHEWAVYVDGVLAIRRSGSRRFTLSMTAGQHLIEIVVASSSFGVLFPSTIRIISARDVLQAPTWHSAIPGYSDPTLGVPGNLLRWYNDPRVGGWSLLRREIIPLGVIVDVNEANRDGEFTVSVIGQWEEEIQIGAAAYAGFEQMGILLTATYSPTQSVTVDAVVYTGITNLRVRLMAEREEINGFWAGRPLGVGVFGELHRMQRVGSHSVIEYIDVSVATGAPYEYVLQAYGLFDPNVLSPYSEVRYLRAGDIIPPGDIIIDPLFPQVVNKRATALFQTPEDEDYAGVRVYFENVLQEALTSPGGSTSTTFVLAEDPGEDIAEATIEITAGTGVGQTNFVQTAVGTAADTQFPWDVTPDATSVYTLKRIDAVLTDYGLPNTDDQLSFMVVLDEDGLSKYGNYFFCSFDRSGNEQSPDAGVLWEYDITDDQFVGDNQPPVVSIRQLTAFEQASMVAAPYSDTLNYAIIEIGALDPVDGLVGVTLQYRRRGAVLSTSTGSNGATALTDTTQTWAPNQWVNYLVQVMNGTGEGQEALIIGNGTNVLDLDPTTPFTVIPDATSEYQIAWVANIPANAPTGALDNPQDVRTRWIAVTREENENWVEVRARDQDGLYSVALAYVPDFDATPEFSSVTTRIDPLAHRVFVVGSVDDDTRSILWYTTPAGAGQPGDPALGLTPWDGTTADLHEFADLTLQKDFRFDFPLPDGESKTLYIRPFSGPNATGVEGIDYQKTFNRSPVTSVRFDPQTLGGQVTVMNTLATFLVSPPIEDLEGAIGQGESGVTYTATTVVDPSKVSLWSVNTDGVGEFALDEDNFQYYFVRIVGPESDPALGQVRPIKNNTTTTLELDMPWGTTPLAGAEYQIQLGATWQRLLTSPEDDTPWTPASATTESAVDTINSPPGVLPINRTTGDQYLEFYSVINGTTPENPPNRVLVDEDGVAEMGTPQIWESPPFVMNVSIKEYDDDVRRWLFFAKKGAIPTMTGTADGILDETYKRVDAAILTTREVSFAAGVGMWNWILVPVNSYGEHGTRVAGIKEMDGIEDGTDILTNVGVSAQDNGSAAYNKVDWTHPTSMASDDAYTVKIWVYRADLGPGTEVELTSALTRQVYKDSDGDWDNTNDIDNTLLYGSWLHDTGLTRSASGTAITYVYTVELYQNTTLLDTYQVEHVDRYGNGAPPTFTGTATSALEFAGNCFFGTP